MKQTVLNDRVLQLEMEKNMLEERWTQNVNALQYKFSERICPNEKIMVKNGITHPVVEIDMINQNSDTSTFITLDHKIES